VRRFASEAFAFLLRRVKESLSEIVKVILDDVGENKEYSEALMNVFVESMKAPRGNLHSKAIPLFNSLVHYVQNSGMSLPLKMLICRKRVCTSCLEGCPRGIAL
jgi:hypothetical protein